MSANQKPDYRAAPVTQRDGSKLANSNCRMASISTGLDFDTLGKKKSTGARMRTFTTDQDGGTDSGDAKQAWAKGYAENLDIQDGKTWADVLADLRQFRYVHIDVWHRTVGGPCLSGTGAYGHTMVIAPDCVNNEWLVSDPWCNPPRWTRVSEAKLKAGAEEWGRRVYGAATSGPGASNDPSPEVLRHIVRRLMSRYHPGDDGEEDPTEDPGDTGGVQRVMYTASTAHAPATTPTPPTGGTDMGIVYRPERWKVAEGTPFYASPGGAKVGQFSKAMTVTSLGPALDPADSDGIDYSYRAVLVVSGAVTNASERKVVWIARPTGDPVVVPAEWKDGTWALLNDPSGVYPCPPGTDCSDAVVQAVNVRDGQWREWALEGSPGQRVRSRMDDGGETKET